MEACGADRSLLLEISVCFFLQRSKKTTSTCLSHSEGSLGQQTVTVYVVDR